MQDYFIDTTVTKAEELLRRLDEFSQSLIDAAATPSTPTSARRATGSPATISKSGKKVSRAELQKVDFFSVLNDTVLSRI